MEAINPDKPEQKYSISYSQELQEKTLKALKTNAQLKLLLLGFLGLIIVLFSAIIMTGVFGKTARVLFCP